MDPVEQVVFLYFKGFSVKEALDLAKIDIEEFKLDHTGSDIFNSAKEVMK